VPCANPAAHARLHDLFHSSTPALLFHLRSAAIPNLHVCVLSCLTRCCFTRGWLMRRREDAAVEIAASDMFNRHRATCSLTHFFQNLTFLALHQLLCLFLQCVPRALRPSLPRECLFECRTFVLTRGHPYWSRCGAGAAAQGRGMRCVQQRDCMNGIVIVVLTEPHVSKPPVSQHDADCAACPPFSLFAWPPDGLASRPRPVPPSFTYDPELAFALLHTCSCAPRPNVASRM
jgi:hypothetical protein